MRFEAHVETCSGGAWPHVLIVGEPWTDAQTVEYWYADLGSCYRIAELVNAGMIQTARQFMVESHPCLREAGKAGQ